MCEYIKHGGFPLSVELSWVTEKQACVSSELKDKDVSEVRELTHAWQ